MEQLEHHESFVKLKHLCNLLLKEPTIAVCKDIIEYLPKTSNNVMQDMLEFALYPIVVHLENNKISKNVKQHLVECLKAVLLKTRLKQIKRFWKLYSLLLSIIHDRTTKNTVINNHEELKESVIICLRVLFSRCTTDVVESIYNKENNSLLAPGIYKCVVIAKFERSQSLRVAAIDTLMGMLQVHDECDRNDIVLQSKAADILLKIIPGIVDGLLGTALGNEIQGHKITMIAVKAFGRIVSLEMQDALNSNSLDTPEGSDLNIYTGSITISDNHKNDKRAERSINVSEEEILKSGERTREWINIVAMKLKMAIVKLGTLKTNSHFRVRKELVETVTLILTTCSKNMKPSFMDLIEILISLSEDDNPEVRNEARKTLNEVNERWIKGNMKSLIEILEEHFYDFLMDFPRIMRKSDDAEQLVYLNQLLGLLRLLGKERLPRIMSSVPYLKRLLLALVYAIEIDTSVISLLEDANVKGLEDIVYQRTAHLWREHKFIHDTAVEEKVKLVCKLLGDFGDFIALTDNILGLMTDYSRYRKELTLLLNWIICVPVDSSRISAYKDIVDFYTEKDFWYLPLEVSDEITLRNAQNNVAQSCLLTEGLGIIAEILGHEYQTFLLKTLYLVIERAGCRNGLINLVGLQTLEKIAKSQDHETITELLQNNVDYLSYHVTMKLKRFERHPGVLDVVAVIVKYSTIDVLPCLKNIIEDVGEQCNKNCQQPNAYAFLKVFHIFMVCLRKLVPEEKSPRDTVDNFRKEADPAETVILAILDYYNAKKISENFEDDENVTETTIDENVNVSNVEDDENIELPFYVKMTEDVMRRCLHYIPSKKLNEKLLALATLKEGLIVLSKHENQLLPIVHEIWHPLVDRFRDPNLLVVNRSWELLQTLASVSKDFIKSRTLKQVLPPISDFLHKTVKESHKKDSGSAYKFTQMYKLQKELLSHLADMAIHLGLCERDLWEILSMAEPYLSNYQNPTLQECCVTLYKTIADYNPHIAWVKCISVWSLKIAPVPKPYNIDDLEMSTSKISNEYYKNLRTILDYINGKSPITYLQ